ncbi:MAG: TetR/AcrR family transcriptional regulator [Nocardioides sp.]
MSSAPANPRRRAPRSVGDRREQAILDTARAALGTRPFSELSVEDLTGGAGISRSTFYFYFASKDAVLLRLLEAVIAEVSSDPDGHTDLVNVAPVEAWRRTIAAYVGILRRHQRVIEACLEARATNQEARRLWNQALEEWVGRVAAAIDFERARRAAPEGLPSRELAIALVSLSERADHATQLADGPHLDADRTVEVLTAVWVTAIYQTPTPSAGPARGDG